MIETIRIGKPNYQKKLEEAFNGYPFEYFSIGRMATALMFKDKLNELSILDEINSQNLAKNILEMAPKNIDYGYGEIKKHLEYLYKIQLPELSDTENFKEFKTERDYLDYLSGRIQSNNFIFSQLPAYTQKRLTNYRDSINFELNEHTTANVNMKVLPGKQIGLPFDLYIRAKSPESLVLKTIERTGNIFSPNYKSINKFVEFTKKNPEEKEDLESKLGFKLSKDIQTLNYVYTLGCTNLVKKILTSGQDTQAYIDNIHPNSIDNVYKEYVGKLFLVDNIGCRIVGQNNVITKIDNYFFNNADTLIKGKYNNYLKTNEKDLAIVIPLKVKEQKGAYVELRLQTPDRVARGDFGEQTKSGKIILPHSIYKLDKGKGISNMMSQSESFNSMTNTYIKHFGMELNQILPHLGKEHKSKQLEYA